MYDSKGSDSVVVTYMMAKLPIDQDLRGYSVSSANNGESLQTTPHSSLSLQLVYNILFEFSIHKSNT